MATKLKNQELPAAVALVPLAPPAAAPAPTPTAAPTPHAAALTQGEPWDHLMPGLTVSDYVRHGGGAPLMPLSAVARSDLKGLAFREGYAPFAPFTGSLLDERRWRRRNRRRLAALQQPAGLWGGTSG